MAGIRTFPGDRQEQDRVRTGRPQVGPNARTQDPTGDGLLERLVKDVRAKLLAHPYAVSDAAKLTIDVYRRANDTFDINLTIKIG